MGTGQRMVRRSAGVLAGLVLGGVTVGMGAAHADDGIVWGCPSDYSLEGTSCRAANGSTIGALGLVPGDVDPTTGRVLLPLTGSTDPAPPDVTTVPTTTVPTTTVPTTTVPPVKAPPVTTTLPRPSTTAPSVPPAVGPCVGATPPVAGSSDVTRTAAAVDDARARLAADLRRGAPPATISADAQALTTAIRAHAAALAASRAPVVCPTR